MNVFVMIVSMAAVAHSDPNYAGVAQAAGTVLGGTSITPDSHGVYPPVRTSAALPPSDAGFTGALVGLVSDGTFYQVFTIFIQLVLTAIVRRCRPCTLTEERCSLYSRIYGRNAQTA